MDTRRCSFCGTTENLGEPQTGTNFETLPGETVMCTTCSASLSTKAKETEKVYEWTDRDASG